MIRTVARLHHQPHSSLPRLLQEFRTAEGRVVQLVDFVPVRALDQVPVDIYGRLDAGVARPARVISITSLSHGAIFTS